MGIDAGQVAVFAEGREGAAFVVWLCLGMAVVAGAALLLPWPPDFGGAAMAVVVFAVCGAAIWIVGGRREVSFEPATRTVVERSTFVGWTRERRWPLGADVAVEVSQKTTRVAKPGTDAGHRTSTDYAQRSHYLLTLRSGAAQTTLDRDDDVLAAERRAVDVAARIGARPVRFGYATEVERVADACGTRVVVRVRSAPGETVAIVAPP
jgi:hypothetical protein